MRHYYTTLTERGQVTLPAEIRRQLGVKPKQKVHFAVEGDTIRIVPSPLNLESIRGIAPPLAARKSLEEIYEIAGDEHARHVLDEMARP